MFMFLLNNLARKKLIKVVWLALGQLYYYLGASLVTPYVIGKLGPFQI